MDKYESVEAWRAHMEEGLTPEDWETLHREAKANPRGGPLKIPRSSLPAAPKPSKRTAEQHLGQMIKACGKDEVEDYARKRTHAYIGRPYPGGYVTKATNGEIMILQKGDGQGEPCHRLHPSATHTITISDPTFELVLKRARICSNERSHGVTFTAQQYIGTGVHDPCYGRTCLLVEASQGDDWDSREYFLCDLPIELLNARWALNVDYLLPCCGRWPWRWEVGANTEGDKFDAASTSPHAIYWDADGTAMLIMPMRV